MAQQPITAIRDVPLVGHDQDGNTMQGHDVKLGQGISQGDCSTTSILHRVFLLCLASLI